MKQFEIWWAELPKPAGRRPVLLLSRDEAYKFLNKVVVAEITATVRHIPVEVLLGETEGLPKMCVANFDNLRTVPKQCLSERVARLPPRRVVEVKRAMGFVFGWDELIDAES